MCLNCNKDGYNNKFVISGRGYGSIFDQDNIEFNLCDDCIKSLKVKQIWFDEMADENGEYQYENEVWNLLNQVRGELLTNICSSSIITLQ